LFLLFVYFVLALRYQNYRATQTRAMVRGLVAGLSPRGSGFDPRAVNVGLGFLVDVTELW